MEIIVRKTNEDDWLDLKNIRLSSLKDAPKAFGSTFAKAAKISDQEWRDRAGNRMALTYFMAYLNASSVGLIGGAVQAGEYSLISMWVSPDHRRKGVGELLVDAVFRHAHEQGFAEVVLAVSQENKAASALYQKKGFTFVQHYERLANHPEILYQKMVAKINPRAYALSK